MSREEEYRKVHEDINNLATRNFIAQDTALLQVSVGMLAALATLGNKLLIINKTLSILIFVSFGLTITCIILGYYFSNKFFEDARKKVDSNFPQAEKKLVDGLDEIITGRISKWLNSTQFATFIIGLVLFGFVVVLYIGGLNG